MRVLSVQPQMRTFDYLRFRILPFRHGNNLSASLQTKYLCAAETQTRAKHTVAKLDKMRTDEHCHLFWEDVKQKATKLDYNAPKLSRNRIAPARIEEFIGGKAALEYAILFSTIIEYILNPYNLTRKISEHTSTSKIFC